MLWLEAAQPAPRRFESPARLKFRRTAGPRGEDGRVLIINGHPDPRPERFCAALCGACLDGVRAQGRQADTIALGALPAGNAFDGEQGSAQWARAFDLVRRSSHLTVVFPLWLDKPPPLLVNFFEQAAEKDARDRRTGVARRSAHLVVTMAMPAFAHRSILRTRLSASSPESLISLPGVEADELSLVGSVDAISQIQRQEWLDRIGRVAVHGTRKAVNRADEGPR